MLRSAIERNLEIVGEAMVQLRKLDPALASHFSHVRDIAAFRNQLVHAYMTLADATVWSIVQTYLPLLLQEVAAALQRLG
jgi:uncharacterized protein with HEPN domain